MRLIPNPELAAELGRDPRYQHALSEAAGEVRDAAERLAPRGPDPRGGHVADHIRVVEEDGEVRVAIRDPFGHLVEWGSRNNPPYAPLRRGVQAAGLRFREQQK